MKLSIESGEELAVLRCAIDHYVSVDVDLKRIGLARQELAKVPNATPAQINERGYVQKLGRSIADKLALEIDGAPLAFEYVGPVDEGGTRWYAFELVKER